MRRPSWWLAAGLLMLAGFALALLVQRHLDRLREFGPGAHAGVRVTDLAGREVLIPKPPERIALLRGRDIYELAVLLGDDLPHRLVALGSDLDTADHDAYRRFVERFPELARLPGGDDQRGTLNPEAVIALHPDLIVLDVALQTSGARVPPMFEKAGIPIVYLDLSGDPWRSPQRSLLVLGRALGREARAQEIVAYADRQIDLVLDRLANTQERPPSVYLEAGGNPMKFGNTYGSGGSNQYSSWGQILNRLKVDNVADRMVSSMGRISPEYLLAADPQAIVLTGQHWTTDLGAARCGYYANAEESRALLRGFLARPGWNGLAAVREHRIVSVFHNFSMHVFAFAGIQALAKTFYPKTFADLDPERGLREFHERFLPVGYSGVWMLALDDPPPPARKDPP